MSVKPYGRSASEQAIDIHSPEALLEKVEIGVPYYAKFKRKKRKIEPKVKPKKRSKAEGKRKRQLKILRVLLPLLAVMSIWAYLVVHSGPAPLPALTVEDFAPLARLDSVRTAGMTVYLKSSKAWSVEDDRVELEELLGRLGERAEEAGYTVLVLSNPGGEMIGTYKTGAVKLRFLPKNT